MDLIKHFQNYLHRRLTFPLSIAVAILLTLAVFFPWQGLFVNLASTLIGSLITILYIDFILKENEQREWRGAEKIVYRNINNVLTSIIGLLGLQLLIYRKVTIDDVNHRRYLHKIETILPVMNECFKLLGEDDWKEFALGLKQIEEETNQIIDLYGGKLKPDIFSLLLELVSRMKNILTSYAKFERILSWPEDNNAPPQLSRDKSVALGAITEEYLSLVKISKSLLEKINLSPPIP